MKVVLLHRRGAHVGVVNDIKRSAPSQERAAYTVGALIASDMRITYVKKNLHNTSELQLSGGYSSSVILYALKGRRVVDISKLYNKMCCKLVAQQITQKHIKKCVYKYSSADTNSRCQGSIYLNFQLRVPPPSYRFECTFFKGSRYPEHTEGW